MAPLAASLSSLTLVVVTAAATAIGTGTANVAVTRILQPPPSATSPTMSGQPPNGRGR